MVTMATERQRRVQAHHRRYRRTAHDRSAAGLPEESTSCGRWNLRTEDKGGTDKIKGAALRQLRTCCGMRVREGFLLSASAILN